MKVIKVQDTYRGIEVFMESGNCYIGVGGEELRWFKDSVNITRVNTKTERKISYAYIQWLEGTASNKHTQNDKQVYFDKKWQSAQFVSQMGMCVTMRHKDHGDFEVPFVHVRDKNPHCEICKDYLFRNSFQTNKGTSYCHDCYQGLDSQELELLFNGPQWMAWEGQMCMREMEQSHLVNSLNRLKQNATNAAEIAGGREEDYLHPSFDKLVEELHRRRPMEEKIKANSYMLYIWSILFMLFGVSKKDSDESSI